MQTGLSLQHKGPGRGMPSLQQPSHKPSLLSKLILAPAFCSYLTTIFFTAFMSKRGVTKTVISSAYMDTITEKGPAKKILCRAGLAFSLLSLWSRGSKLRTERRGERGQTCLTNHWIAKVSEHFTCTTACRLWYIILIHLWNSGLNLAVSKTVAKTDGQTNQRPWIDANWPAQLQCHLLTPLGPHTPSASCLGLIFPSQHNSAQVWSNH